MVTIAHTANQLPPPLEGAVRAGGRPDRRRRRLPPAPHPSPDLGGRFNNAGRAGNVGRWRRRWARSGRGAGAGRRARAARRLPSSTAWHWELILLLPHHGGLGRRPDPPNNSPAPSATLGAGGIPYCLQGSVYTQQKGGVVIHSGRAAQGALSPSAYLHCCRGTWERGPMSSRVGGFTAGGRPTTDARAAPRGAPLQLSGQTLEELPKPALTYSMRGSAARHKQQGLLQELTAAGSPLAPRVTA